jgi:hypothetical protein
MRRGWLIKRGGIVSPPLKTVDVVYYHSYFSHKMCDPLALSLKVVISLNFILYQRVIPVKTEMKALPWGYLLISQVLHRVPISKTLK